VNFEIMNAYGGVNHFPDPVHVIGSGMTVTNYTMNRNAIPADPTLHGGVPGGLIFGSDQPTPNITVNGVTVIGFLEFDVQPLVNLQMSNVTATHCLIGNMTGTSWGGTVWNNVNLDWLAGPALQFNLGSGPYTNWTIEYSTVVGTIGNPSVFNGTWGPGNTPAVI